MEAKCLEYSEEKRKHINEPCFHTVQVTYIYMCLSLIRRERKSVCPCRTYCPPSSQKLNIGCLSANLVLLISKWELVTLTAEMYSCVKTLWNSSGTISFRSLTKIRLSTKLLYYSVHLVGRYTLTLCASLAPRPLLDHRQSWTSMYSLCDFCLYLMNCNDNTINN